ncbi:aspartyl-phosphate phosphatase Spo0E family protein [Halobacillus kuroshimensis]|uniref:Aspartyl-phosphate phosphatase Spo0E family protein n=1 Tax=Halobacillus kuroshimensis TaxID=302481 RepID=A0ABS3DUA3_9BACI|nr:aspartyl-phosphate phosphatase Spo0E family protein [Halobacillus kuroshimensis]MBN8234922.1 aspartyl-phosphate phosphatase Spo0E family protein [Halobacillus kuroshimensis]
MSNRDVLKKQIEEKRQKMYNAYLKESNYNNVVKISQELDALLNRLNSIAS